MRITIVGGGNIGTQFAVHCAEKQHEVIVYTSKQSLFDRRLRIIDENGNTTHAGEIRFATDDPVRAFQDAELILVTLPPMVVGPAAKVIYEHTDRSVMIGVVPGNGGIECAFGPCIERGNIFFGIERVPAIARLLEPGKTVCSTGYRSELHVSSLPSVHAERCSALIEEIFDIPCRPIANYLNLTMTPSNPILHTTRLRTLFGDWQPGMRYPSVPLFYEHWNDASSELLLACDDEVQQICRALPEFDLTGVKSLREHYESPTVQAMTKKISGIPAFRGLPTPMVECDGGWIPDLKSRYFTADFSYGLSIIKQIAEFAGVSTPNIDGTLHWYRTIAVVKDEFHFADFGISDREALRRFYLR